MSTANTGGLDRVLDQCRKFRTPDVRQLLNNWEKRLAETTHARIDQQLDGRGQRMPDVTYRPAKKKTREWSRGDQGRHLSGFSRIDGGRREESAGNNLTSAQYRKLTGPPLAPRGRGSRVHTNFRTQQGYDGTRGVFFAVGAWFDIISRKGVPFILAHFLGLDTGRVKLKVRDLRGIAPADQAGFMDDLEAWGVAHTKATFI
jgi:hypothetical protein